jgi:hypothetical protein
VFHPQGGEHTGSKNVCQPDDGIGQLAVYISIIPQQIICNCNVTVM